MVNKKVKNKNGKTENFTHYPHFGVKQDEATFNELTELVDISRGLASKCGNAKEGVLNRYYETRKIPEEDLTVFDGYSFKVLTSNWFVSLSSYPKDYDAYSPPGGNNFRSSYNRWGTSEGRMISETQAAQESFWREYKKPQPKHRHPMINVFTLRNIDFNRYKELLPSQAIKSEESGKSTKKIKPEDLYSTTMQRDFINYNPTEPEFLDRVQLYKPETKYRNLLTEIAHPRRPGFNKFFDENLEYLNTKKTTKITPPPWALHYTPCDDLLTKETSTDKKIQIEEVSKQSCAKCT